MNARLLIALLVGLVLVGCTSAKDATKALTSAGFKDIEITGYDYLACSDDDTFRTGFKAVGPTGKHVEGAVCSGWFKGATIRFE